MRVVMVGAGDVAVETARRLIERGVEVVLIEQDRDRIDELSDELDCGFLHGDGSRPVILQEAGPKETDMLICLGDDDQRNIIAGLVGRSLGYARVVTSIHDAAFEHVCHELGLGDTIIPSRTISRYLADMAHGVDVLELSSLIKGEARLFTFGAGKGDAGPLEDLDLPGDSRVICVYRGKEAELLMPEDDLRLRKDDEVVVLTRSRHLQELEDRWRPQQAETLEESDGERGEEGSASARFGGS